jgi:signal transduction histidine kinase
MTATVRQFVRENVWACAACLALLIGGQLETWLSGYSEGHRVTIAAFAALWSLPVLLARRAPIVAEIGILLPILILLYVIPHDVFNEIFFTFFAFLVATFIGGTARPTSLAVAGLALAIAAATIVQLTVGDNAGDIIGTALVGTAVWVAAYLVGRRTAQTRELKERAARLERERDMEARAAVAEERARIAREMHDVVAHSLSVMVVQAEAAEAMLDTDPERARRPLAAVQDTGRSALTELRRMLGVLREIADEGPALAPQPGLAGLDELVGNVRDAGLPVEVRIEGEPRPLPPGIDLSAYRIVQEGLTNALKHAGPARAEVLVRYGDRELELRVTDDGPGLAEPSPNGSGHGLVGMRERVALYGGELSAGPRPEGGFALDARLPLEVLQAT